MPADSGGGRFLVDMGLAVRVAEWLRAEGHDAVHLREEGHQRLPDDLILAKAIAERRVLLTCDLDFGEIVALSRLSQVGVVLFRLSNLAAARAIDRLARILPDTREALSAGAIVLVEEDRHRVRRLPIGPR